MKKQIFAGFVILIVLFFVTCDGFLPKDGDEVEYTDVVYSEDGTQITLYLDGVGVPKTRSQRAITRDLAKMAYDYFEVVFITLDASSDPVAARAQWELGQSAGISGIVREPTGKKGQDYKWEVNATNYPTGKDANVALMFVGKKDDKTLLGVGQIGEVDHSASFVVSASVTAPPGWADAVADTAANYTGAFTTGINSATGLPNTIFAYIRPSSSSVTFYVEAIKTGLLIGKETEGVGSTHNAIDALTDSFQYNGNGDVDPSPITLGTTGWGDRVGHSKRQAPNIGSKALYPIYSLPEEKNDVQVATYTIKGAAQLASFATGIRYNADAVISDGSTGFIGGPGIVIERRFPRYLEGGRYRQLKENVDTDTTVEVNTDYTGYNAVVAAGTYLNPVVPLKFTTKGTGVFSFFLEIPVYMIRKTQGTNSGELQPIIWKLRTGLGSELYSLDSGKGSGGCVLMGIGDIDLDWLDIYWEWVD